MKFFYTLIATIFLFVSCSKSESDNDEISNIELNFTQFDVTLISGNKSIGVIDNDIKKISLPDVKDPLEITSVTYKYSDDVSIITPNPDTRIGQWELIETFRLHSGGNFEDYTVEIPDYEEPVFENQATISPLETYGATVKYHMIDLNEDPTDITVAKANVGFGEKGMNGIRFPLYCGDAFGGHPEEGVVIESVYEKPLTSLANAKAAYSGSEPFMIFLGIKVLTSNKAEYFPDWVTTEQDDVANPEKYAQLIVDFISFMDKKGHTINAFAFDKEAVRMSTDNFKIAVDTLRARTERLGFVVPQIVAPELLDPQGDVPSGYMNTLYNKGLEASYDIFGNHYYQRSHTDEGFAKLKYEFDLAQSDKPRTQWATEPHWNGDPDVWVAETAIGCMFDHTDLGLEAFMWWDYPITGGVKPKQSIMRAYSDAIHRSTPIRMIDHDGEETLTKGKLHTRAYKRDNEVNVFLINVVNPNIDGIVPVSYEDYVIGVLDGFNIDGKVTMREWRDDIDIEGVNSIVDPIEENQLFLDIPTGSFIQLTFKITEK